MWYTYFMLKFVKSNNWTIAFVVCIQKQRNETDHNVYTASIYRVKMTRTEPSCFPGFRS